MPDIDPFIPPRDLPGPTGLSQTTLWREQRAGRFPPFDELSARRKGLRLSWLKEWQNGRRDWQREAEAAAKRQAEAVAKREDEAA